MKQTLDAYLDKLTGLDDDKVDQLVEEAKALIGDHKRKRSTPMLTCCYTAGRAAAARRTSLPALPLPSIAAACYCGRNTRI